MNWLRLIVFLSGAGILTTSLPGAPVCPTATLAVYTSPSFAPCTVGSGTVFLFSNFGFSTTSTDLSASDIEVTPSDLPHGGLDLDFSSNFEFNLGSGQSAQFTVSYTIDPPPPPEIPRFQLTVDPATLATTELCINAAFSNGVCPTQSVMLSVAGSGTNITNLKGTVGELGVIDTLSISAGTSDPTIPFPNFGNTALTTIPEPATGLFGAFGLALVALLTRRMATKFR